jgi:hypothetical protein
LEDDLDGGPAEETIHFQLGAHEYEIDLNAVNAGRFRAQMAPFVSHARKAGRGRSRAARSTSVRRRSADIRKWAKERGMPVSDRGRIPASVLEQYETRDR